MGMLKAGLSIEKRMCVSFSICNAVERCRDFENFSETSGLLQ
jgi:hypothetical protein